MLPVDSISRERIGEERNPEPLYCLSTLFYRLSQEIPRSEMAQSILQLCFNHNTVLITLFYKISKLFYKISKKIPCKRYPRFKNGTFKSTIVLNNHNTVLITLFYKISKLFYKISKKIPRKRYPQFKNGTLKSTTAIQLQLRFNYITYYPILSYRILQKIPQLKNGRL